MNWSPPAPPAPPAPPLPQLPPSFQTPPVQPPPSKSGRRKNILIGVLAAGCLISVGVAVGAAAGSSNDEAEAEATVTGVDDALDDAFQSADDSTTPPDEVTDAVAEYGDEIGALMIRAGVVIDGITDTAQSAGDDLGGWIGGDYGTVTIDQWTEATAIYDAWLEVEVPAGYGDLDDATGAVFRSLVDTTDDFSDSAIAGNIDDALSSLELALEGLTETNLLIDEAQVELDRL